MKLRTKTKSKTISVGQTNEELKKLYDMKTKLTYKIMELDEDLGL